MTLYRPTGSDGARYRPDSFVTPCHTVTPVSAFTIETAAFGTIASDESVTVPEILPVRTWPTAMPANRQTIKARTMWRTLINETSQKKTLAHYIVVDINQYQNGWCSAQHSGA